LRELLLEKMELLRQQMVKIGLECGLDHPKVLEYSQRIDQLHNELNQMDQGLSKAEKPKKRHRFYILENQANYA
jgi:hypothetical protein